MKPMNMITYRIRGELGHEGRADLVKKFVEVGQPAGVIAHYVRLDGGGGYMLQEQQDDPEAVYENALRYLPWIDIEITPIGSIDEAFPVVLRVYS